MLWLHAIIHGKVQGVSFRHDARQEALRLGVTGWVRNLPDLSVETLAVGEREALEGYVQWLHHGPPAARVERVEVTWSTEPTESLTTFEIRYGRLD